MFISSVRKKVATSILGVAIVLTGLFITAAPAHATTGCTSVRYDRDGTVTATCWGGGK